MQQQNRSKLQPNSSQSSGQSDTQTYTIEFLQSQTVKQLRSICSTLKLRARGKKKEIITIIAQSQGTPIPTSQDVRPSSFSKDYLDSKTVKELKAICAELKLRARGKKDEIIDLILKVSSSSSTISKQLDLLEQTNHSKVSGIHHQTYRDNFNFVDLNNKDWYRCYYTYAVNNWRAKMLISLLEEATLNIHTIHNESSAMAWL